MTTFLEALKPYINSRSGMVSLYRDDGGIDNFFLVTAHAIRLAERLGEDTTTLRPAAIVYALASMRPEPGLLRRRPEDHGATSYDELIGAAVAGKTVAYFILDYGWRNLFCYNVENPGVFSWRFFFARNICFVPFLRAASGGKPNLLQQLGWAIGVWLSTFAERENTSGRLLVDVQLETMAGYRITDAAIRYFNRKMTAMYGGRRALYRIYFPAGHPIAEFQLDAFNDPSGREEK